MIKFLNILSDVLTEAKRYQLSPETRFKLISVVEDLWNNRKKEYKGKTLVDVIPFKMADGTDGLARVIVNPRLKYIGYMGTKPKNSYDPADLYIEVSPKYYESKKNLYLTLFHEMMHASDPMQSHKWSPKYDLTYDEKSDDKYWGHPTEFFAISNEFLEGLVNEFERRAQRLKKKDNSKPLLKSLQNIMNYFAKNEPLTKQSLNIIQRINDDSIGSGKFGEILANIETDYPETSDIIPPSYEDEPYYLHYVQMIKKFNPEIWKKFLSMLFTTSKEIENMINTKKGV
jgi:hypothetical protein